jgi:hypothetical protein
MAEDEPSASRRDPFEDAYRAYVRAMKEAWAEVDVEAVVRQGRPHWPFHPMNTWTISWPVPPVITSAPCVAGTWGSFGTFGTYGTGWSSAGDEPPESTQH